MNYWTEACAGNDTGDLPLPPPPVAAWHPPVHLAHWTVPGTERGTIGAHEPRIVWLGFVINTLPDPITRAPSTVREILRHVLARH